MAQHYRVPTRFLDWSESPLVAAYVAVAETAKALATPGSTVDQSGNVGIFILATGRIKSETWKTSLAIGQAPRYMNDNLRAQKGLFIYVRDANSWFIRGGSWLSLEEVLVITGDSHHLESVTLPATESDEMLRLLWKYDVTRHHLEPTLENAAKSFSYARALFPERGPGSSNEVGRQ
jgi:FRG domain